MVRIKTIFFILLITSCTSQIETTQIVSENSYDITDRVSVINQDSLKNEITYYANGNKKSEINYLEDERHFIYKDYYPNGQLKKQGEQGVFESCGMLVNDELLYDSTGYLIEKKSYFHYLEDENDGCHGTQTIISDTIYYPSGRILATQKYKTCYDCEEYPCGVWIEYDINGVEVKKVDYGECE